MKKSLTKPIFRFDAKPFTINLTPTDRGFLCGEFTDRNGQACSIQESSIATEFCLWLGCDEGEHHHVTGDCMARMHLTQEMAQALVPLLVRFALRGTLAPLPLEEQAENLRDGLLAGNQTTDCTCAPPHTYQSNEGRCPYYTAALEDLLREIRQTGFIRNTAHKIRARIDALMPPTQAK